jgi:uncharacterized protein YyaL (SSP411 family)
MSLKKIYLFLFLILFLGAGWRWMSQKPSGESFKHTNLLVREKSPYLLQHAHNPVDWRPWGEEAFEKAKRENKPVFLSIGYSTCHWCHVMERESFEDEAVAKIMNEHFVCIKVDREERPDVDQIYMNAVMMLTGSGGWPLNVFLTPDLKPFYGGTYFAPDERYGRPGFPSVLRDVARAWETKPQEIEKAGKQLAEVIQKPEGAASQGVLNNSVLEQALGAFAQGFDPKDGGFRGAPKFPPSMALQFLLRIYQKTGEAGLLPMVEVTLDKMAQGGIYDQVGGGFSRYSTDNKWLVPHFEKMLYDNALLSRTYLEAFQATGNEEYARVAREVFEYLFRDMTDPEGGFYSAEDADSEGVEGKFYLWTPESLKKILGEKDGEDFCRLYGVTEHGNFEEGHTILHLRAGLPESLKAVGRDAEWLGEVKAKVLAARSLRIRPHRDDKILMAWNSLMISSLASAFQVLGDSRFLQAAEKAAEFISKKLIKDGRLMASYRQGPSDVQGFLDDYAFYQAAQLDLYESTFNPVYLKEALRLGQEITRLFGDEKNGGYFFTGSDQKDRHRLLARNKETYDGVIPSGNAVAALNDLRLGEFTGKKEYREKALRVLTAFGGVVAASPSNYPKMLQAFQFDYYGPSEILVVGPRAESEKFLKLVWKANLPNRVMTWAEDSNIEGLAADIPWVQGRHSQAGKPAVYICRNFQCQLPVTDEKRLAELLSPQRESPR